MLPHLIGNVAPFYTIGFLKGTVGQKNLKSVTGHQVTGHNQA
jgi:hypothetical protein